MHVSDTGMDIMVKCGRDGTVNFMADIFKSFTEEEIETLWNLLIKLYCFDGVEMDGFEENVQVPNINGEEVRMGLEKFFKRRNVK